MGSLKDCLEKIYGFSGSPEAQAVAKKAAELRKEGYTGREADAEAVKFFLGRLEDERADIMGQVRDKAEPPEHPGQQRFDFAEEAAEEEAMPAGGPVTPRPSTQVQAQKTNPITPGLRRSDTIRHVEKTLSLPIRIGKFRGPYAGIYKRRPEVVRLKKSNDIGTAAHEVAHHIQNLIGLGGRMPPEIKAMAYPGAKNLNREGFAEFVRYYIVDEPKVRREAPGFLKQFLDALDQHPDVANAFTRVKESWNAFMAATPVQRVGSFLRWDDPEKRRYTLDDFFTEWVDSLRPIEILSDAIKERSGAALEPMKDPYTLAWLTRGWPGKAEQMLKYRTFQMDRDKGVRFTGPGLRDILKPIETAGEMKMLDAYLFAKRAVDDARITSGFADVLPRQDFVEVVKELEPKYKGVAEQLYKFQDELLTYLTQSGRISKEMADSYRENNAFYAPLYRVMDDAPPSVSMRGNQSKFSELANPAKRLKGSSRDVFSPIQNIIKNVFAIVNISERNRVGAAVLEATKIKGMGDLIEQIPFPLEPRKINKEDFLQVLHKYATVEQIASVTERKTETEKVLHDLASAGTGPTGRLADVAREALEKRGFSPAEASQIVDRLGKATAPAERKEIIEKTIERTVIMTVKEQLGFGSMPDEVIHTFRPAYRAGPSEAIFYKNGEPILVEMHPALAKAVKGLDPGSFNPLLKALQYPAKWLRAGATLTPEFAARNPMRDQMTAWIYSKYGYVPGLDFVRGIYHLLKVDDLYQKYLASGAAHSELVATDREFLSKKLEQITKMRTPGEWAQHPIHAARKFIIGSAQNPLATVQLISALSEAGSRVGGFARALKKEGGDLNALMRAATEGRDMTLDFLRQGAKAASWNRYTAFFTAQIAGLDKMRRAFRDRPGTTFARAFLGLTVPAVLLWLAQKDDPYWEELPRWRKMLFMNYIFHKPDGSHRFTISIPLPFEIGILFGTLPVMALEWMHKQDPSRFKDSLISLRDALLPNVLPTFAIPWIENYANKSLFFDRPIAPRQTEDLSPYLQFSEQTSDTIKAIARGLNHIPGLRDYANPAKIQNLLQGYTGGTGRYVTESTDALLRATGMVKEPPKPAMRLTELPLIRAFTQRWPSANAQSIEDFYDQYARNKQAWADKTAEMGVRGTGIELKPAEKIIAGMPPELLFQEKAAETLTMLRKQARWVMKSNMEPEKKREALDGVYLMMVNVARGAMGKKSVK